MSNNSTDTNQLTNVIKPRSKALGLNLSATQSSLAAPSNLKSEIVIIPSKVNRKKFQVFDFPEILGEPRDYLLMIFLGIVLLPLHF